MTIDLAVFDNYWLFVFARMIQKDICQVSGAGVSNCRRQQRTCLILTTVDDSVSIEEVIFFNLRITNTSIAPISVLKRKLRAHYFSLKRCKND